MQEIVRRGDTVFSFDADGDVEQADVPPVAPIAIAPIDVAPLGVASNIDAQGEGQ